MRKPIPSEHQEQKRYFELVDLYKHRYSEFKMIHATPNGGKRSKGTAGKMKAEGQRAGYPDISIDVARHGYHGARIEMKRTDGGGGMSDEQKEWFHRLEVQNYYCHCAHGCDAAWEFTVWYLGINLD